MTRITPTTLQSLLTSLLLVAVSLSLLPTTFFFIIIPSFILASLIPFIPESIKSRIPLNLTDQPPTKSVNARRTTTTVLLNNGRTSKSLFLARSFASANCRVILIDERPPSPPSSHSIVRKALHVLTTDYSPLVSQTRFSRAVDKFFLVTAPLTKESREKYVEEVVEIAVRENVDIWWPCSGAGSTPEDARIGERLSELLGKKEGKHGFKAIIQDEKLVTTLHEKDLFMDLLSSLSLPHPATRQVRSIPEALSVIRNVASVISPSSGHRTRLILKASATLDDLGRADMTTYPLEEDLRQAPSVDAGEDSHDVLAPLGDLPATRRKLENLALGISEETPYIVQELIETANTTTTISSKRAPPPSELCTHATVINGRLVAFLVCPSNDMLLTYSSITLSRIGLAAETFTEALLERLGRARDGGREGLTGQFSLDFMIRSKEAAAAHHHAGGGVGGKESEKDKGAWRPPTDEKGLDPDLVCIECNPRVHTGIILLGPSGGKAMVETVLSQLGFLPPSTISNEPIRPSLKAPSQSWFGHDLLVRLPSLLLPVPIIKALKPLTTSIHPLWLAEPSPTITRGDVTHQITWPAIVNDPSWRIDDPLPFLALYHAQWVAVLAAAVGGMVFEGILGLGGEGGGGGGRVKGRWSRLNVSTGRVFEC